MTGGGHIYDILKGDISSYLNCFLGTICKEEDVIWLNCPLINFPRKKRKNVW
jgi:hypothetical protein